MAYHRQGASIRLTTDALPVGIGAILEQEQEGGSYRRIYYASRKLSKVEKRYSQFEREALAVSWACEKFHLYPYGIKFEICTDHKPLVIVLSPKSKPPSARTQRWLLYLQQYQYELTHIRGKDNAVDVLSCLSVGQTQDESTKETERENIKMEESDKQEHPVQTAKPEQCSQPASTAIQPSAQTQT